MLSSWSLASFKRPLFAPLLALACLFLALAPSCASPSLSEPASEITKDGPPHSGEVALESLLEPPSERPFEPRPEPPSDAFEPTPEATPEPRPEPRPEAPPPEPTCPPGHRAFSLPGSYDIGKRLNVIRCVKDADPSGCTPIHAGEPSSVRFITVACGFDPATERDRYNYLVSRITEGFLRIEPYKTLSKRWSIVRNDDLDTGWKHTHKRSHCYEAWVNASGEGPTAVPSWQAKDGVWYNPTLIQAGQRCSPHYTVVIANHSGWAGGSHGDWTGFYSVVGSGNDHSSIRRLRQKNETLCRSWEAAYPGRCLWQAASQDCLCDDDLPESAPGLSPNPRLHPSCTAQDPLGCPWPFTHPDIFMEYTAIHEVGHTFLGFAHPSSGSQASPVEPSKAPNNCYLPPPFEIPDPSKPCPGWEGPAFLRWVLPHDSLGSEPKTFGCHKGCADNLSLYAPWQGAQMMIRDDELQYGFSPVERKITEDRLLSECWLKDQIDPLNPARICRSGPNFDPRYGTGLVYQATP